MCKYMVELTLDQVNETLTALHTRMDELRELYYKCKDSKPNYPAETQRIYKKYITLKCVCAQIENANYVRLEGEAV